MGEHDDLHARTNERLTLHHKDQGCRSRSCQLIVDLDDALRAVEAERDELRIAIHGGCGCPAPYTECPHDEPLLPALNKARRRLNALEAERDEARAITSCSLCQARFDVPAADPASGDTT